MLGIEYVLIVLRDESGTATNEKKSNKEKKQWKKLTNDSGGSGWFWIVLLFLVVGVVGFVLYRMQAANQRQQFKRF
jgi:uncharacterized protein HemX